MTDPLSFADPLLSAKATGLSMQSEARIIRLKWHRLRRRLIDPLFSTDVMQDGFRLGASMELDLRVRADGGFVVLHDAELGRETTGNGRIAWKNRDDLAALRFRGDERHLTFSEDLAGGLAAAHSEAVLQFDMKDDLSAIGDRGMAHLADHFGQTSASVILSGDCLELIVAVKHRLPFVRRGIDPTNRLVPIHCDQGAAAVEAALIAELRGPTEPDMVYLDWRLVLRALRDGLDLVALSQAQGVAVDLWTFTPDKPEAGMSVAERADLAALIALGPDQITTDEARLLEQEWDAMRAAKAISQTAGE